MKSGVAAKHKMKKPKLTLEELLVKYQKKIDAKNASQCNNFKQPKSYPRQKFDGQNQHQGSFHTSSPFQLHDHRCIRHGAILLVSILGCSKKIHVC